MKRRLFLQFPLVASALVSKANPISIDRPNKGFKVEANNDRYQEELHIMGGKFYCKVSSKDTDGDLLIYDTIRESKGGPALHIHHSQDEWFYVIRGNFIVIVGEETFTLTSGDSAFAPRTIPHAFAKTSDGEAQMLILFQPAGTMEDFFVQMAKLGKAWQRHPKKSGTSDERFMENSWNGSSWPSTQILILLKPKLLTSVLRNWGRTEWQSTTF